MFDLLFTFLPMILLVLTLLPWINLVRINNLYNEVNELRNSLMKSAKRSQNINRQPAELKQDIDDTRPLSKFKNGVQNCEFQL